MTLILRYLFSQTTLLALFFNITQWWKLPTRINPLLHGRLVMVLPRPTSRVISEMDLSILDGTSNPTHGSETREPLNWTKAEQLKWVSLVWWHTIWWVMSIPFSHPTFRCSKIDRPAIKGGSIDPSVWLPPQFVHSGDDPGFFSRRLHWVSSYLFLYRKLVHLNQTGDHDLYQNNTLWDILILINHMFLMQHLL